MTTTEEIKLARHIRAEDLIARLRKAGNIWFKNEDLLLLEELIRRYQAVSKPSDIRGGW